MPDVTISYNGNSILELSSTSSNSLNTSGKFCKENFYISYVKPPTELVTVNSSSWEKDENDILVLGQNSGSYSHLGKNPQLIKTISKITKTLKNTDYNTWTPSNTAKKIIASTTATIQYGLNFEDYEYVLVWLFDAKIEYASGTTLKAAGIRQIFVIEQYINYRPSNLTNIVSGTDNYGYINTVPNSLAGLLDYYDSSGSRKISQTVTSSGFYPTAKSHELSSTSSLTPDLYIHSPDCYAKCSTSVFSTTMANAVDKDNSVIELTGWLYQVDKGSSAGRSMYDTIYTTYNS